MLDITDNLVEFFISNFYISENLCWEWTGRRIGRNNRYGVIRLNGYQYYAHRVSYEIFVGQIPDKHDIHHKCRNPLCVNPNHLELKTHREHTREHIASDGHPMGKLTYCKRGHEFTPDNTRINVRGARECRECERGRYREKYYIQRKEKYYNDKQNNK